MLCNMPSPIPPEQALEAARRIAADSAIPSQAGNRPLDSRVQAINEIFDLAGKTPPSLEALREVVSQEMQRRAARQGASGTPGSPGGEAGPGGVGGPDDPPLALKTVMVDGTPIEGVSAALFKSARVGYLGATTESGLARATKALPKTKVATQVPA